MLRTLPDARRRVIPQIYKPQEYQDVRDMGYQRIIWTLYRFGKGDGAVLENLRSMDLFAVTMTQEHAEQGLAWEIAKLGIPTYVHTLNQDERRVYFQEQKGVTEIYTDFLSP